MKRIKATKSGKYADSTMPWLPLLVLVEGDEETLEDHFANRIIELGGAEEIEDSVETPEEDMEIETGETDLETKGDIDEESIDNIKKGMKVKLLGDGWVLAEGEVAKVLKHTITIGEIDVKKVEIVSWRNLESDGGDE